MSMRGFKPTAKQKQKIKLKKIYIRAPKGKEDYKQIKEQWKEQERKTIEELKQQYDRIYKQDMNDVLTKANELSKDYDRVVEMVQHEKRLNKELQTEYKVLLESERSMYEEEIEELKNRVMELMKDQVDEREQELTNQQTGLDILDQIDDLEAKLEEVQSIQEDIKIEEITKNEKTPKQKEKVAIPPKPKPTQKKSTKTMTKGLTKLTKSKKKESTSKPLKKSSLKIKSNTKSKPTVKKDMWYNRLYENVQTKKNI